MANVQIDNLASEVMKGLMEYAVEINGYTSGIRPQFAITVADTSVKVPDTVETANGCFELKATTEETQEAVSQEVDEGFLECTDIDISGFDGVKGVEFVL